MRRRESTLKDIGEATSKLSTSHGRDRRLSIASNAGAGKGEHLIFNDTINLFCLPECRLLIILANSVDPDQAQQIIRPDQGSNCLTF